MTTILCAVDFSQTSKDALRWAGALALRRGSSLTVFHAVDPLLDHAARVRLGANLLDDDARAGLRGFAAEAFDICSVQPSDMRVQIVVGDPPSSILAASAAPDVDLIVMGTQGLGGVRRFLMGSTAERVLRGTKVPVLMVPANDPAATIGDPVAGLKRIVAATDFGDGSHAAVQWALALSKETRSALVLVHVVKPIAIAERWRRYVEAFDEEHLAEARAQLARAARESLEAIKECSYVAVLGPPPDMIARVSLEQHAGLIVMGLANRGDADVRRPGSVACSVVRGAHMPVLVVPPAWQPAKERWAPASEGQMLSNGVKVSPVIQAAMA